MGDRRPQERKTGECRKNQWATPFATSYQVEYWDGTNALDFDGGPKGEWKVSAAVFVKNGRGGTAIAKLGDNAISSRYLRS